MSGQLSQWLVNEMFKGFFTPDVYRPQYNRLNLCLLRASIPVGARIAQGSEPYQVGGYVRQSLAFTSSVWKLSGFREVTNAKDIPFPVCTSGWGTITDWALISADFGQIENGQTSIVAATGSFANQVNVVAGTQLVVPAGTLGVGIYDGA